MSSLFLVKLMGVCGFTPVSRSLSNSRSGETCVHAYEGYHSTHGVVASRECGIRRTGWPQGEGGRPASQADWSSRE